VDIVGHANVYFERLLYFPKRTSNMTTHDVCAADELEPGAMMQVAVGSLSLALVRDDDGQFYAMRNSCPHMGAPLAYGRFQARMDAGSGRGAYVVSDDARVIRCPWHGYEFDVRTGRCSGDPDHVGVKTYPVTVEGGRVLIER
jgi:3-phenylpropionate/trans-cinnamate dioxygenase ferredoxin subunit